jgi:hypothetical protein
MSVKNHAAHTGNVHASWLKKREESQNKEGEKKKVVDYFERQKQASGHGGVGNITERLKIIKLKLKDEIKAKLIDDARTTVYAVVKIEKHTGIVTLKNERGTVRKVSVFEKLFDKK